MRDEISIRIAGEAGQGMQTIGIALCKSLKNAGYYIFSNMDYMSRIRGGNNFFQIRISNRPIHTLREKADIIIPLNKESIVLHKDSLTKGGILILDKEKFNPKDNNSKFFNVPFYKMAQDTGGSEIFINSVTSGLIAGILRLEFSYTEEILKSIFHNKDKEVIETNIKAAKSGYAFAKSNFKKDSFTVKKCGKTKDHFILNGNEAIGLGAIYAGCKFYSAYPMSPSTGIMNLVAHYAEKLNIVVEQAEDEIAAINMIIGASFAGARAMTSTSGGGFALMHEGISLAAMTETPVVIANAQRPAPATGFPTRTEQGDLDFLIHSGHGEFAKVVYTPGTIEEAFYLTMKAFDIAEKYQVPVLILTDQHLADSNRNIDPANLKIIKIERHIISKSASKDIKEYKRYKLTKSGISPRAIPSWIDGVIYADSDEHTESGHITEDGAIRVKMVEKRLHKKMALLKKDTEKLKTHNLDNAHTVIIGFGSTYGALNDFSQLRESKKFGIIHIPQVWPFPSEELDQKLKKTKRIITIENNAGAQLAKLIKRETGLTVDKTILKFDGRPFNLDILLDEVSKEA